MINVTKTYLPDKSKFKGYVDRIYESGWLTNNGQFVQELEKRLAEYLGVENLMLVTNGTMALQIAFRTLGMKGKVITTPFSFVATTSSLVWEGITPVFADIDSGTFNITAESIHNKITGETTAILPVHVFGNPCEADEIEKLAQKHGLKLLFDAAHAFGVNYKNTSVLNYGDASILSFHSTKIFHTIEGGAIIFRDRKNLEKARRMINFGITGYDQVEGLGINAKMNEFQAVMGICILDDIEELLNRRSIIYMRYADAFRGKRDLKLQELNPQADYNYAYFPVIFTSEKIREKILGLLNKKEIFPRRYFSPSLDTLDYLGYDEKMAVSDQISRSILCLPLYESLNEEDQDKIIEIVLAGITTV
jgi:dTDP-4-amino-4,6-dideoxygalactose transaminase